MRESFRETQRSYESGIRFEQLLHGTYALLDDKQKQRVKEAKPLAMRMFAALELLPVATVDTNPKNIEKAWLVLALADAVMKKSSNDALAKKLFPRIYAPSESLEIARQIPDTFNLMGPNMVFLHELFIRADLVTTSEGKQKGRGSPFLSWEPSYNAISDVLQRVFHNPAYRDKKGRLVVTLPYTESEANDIIRSYAAGAGLRQKSVTFFDICISFTQQHKQEWGIVFFRESPLYVKKHEYEHMDFPGLRVGALFSSMDEAKTETRAYEKTPVTDKPGPSTWYTYRPERQLLGELAKKGLGSIIDQQYEKHTVSTTTHYIAGLVNHYGLSGYLTLARAYPQLSFSMPADSFERLGVLSTWQAALRL